MQETRQIILEILRESGQATVDDIVRELRQRRGEITAVTVRHHLSRLQQENLITAPKLLHRSTPGRPQHVYQLTEKAQEHFPNNYQKLATEILQQLENRLSPDSVNVIMEGVADSMAAEVDTANLSLADRLERAVQYLNDHGYEAGWEVHDEGFILHTRNCPYHEIAESSSALCNMDMRLVSTMIGVVPRLLSRASNGDATCAYLISSV